ncbi:MAG: L-seryl-tRNA(Sec) selenium transferase, partial [Solirubrobacteraceae bacterium]
LEATLALHRDPGTARRELPVLAALERDPAELTRRAAQLAQATGGVVVETSAKVGGGSLPLLELPGPAVAYPGVDPGRLAAALRAGDPPLLGRIADGTFLADPRALTLGQLAEAAAALRATLPLPAPEERRAMG